MPKSTAATSFEDWARHNKAVEIVTVLKQAGAGPDMAAAIGPEQIKLAAQAARIEGFSDATAKLVKDMLAGKVSSAKMAKPQPVKLTGTEDLEGALSESLKWIEARKAKN